MELFSLCGQHSRGSNTKGNFIRYGGDIGTFDKPTYYRKTIRNKKQFGTTQLKLTTMYTSTQRFQNTCSHSGQTENICQTNRNDFEGNVFQFKVTSRAWFGFHTQTVVCCSSKQLKKNLRDNKYNLLQCFIRSRNSRFTTLCWPYGSIMTIRQNFLLNNLNLNNQ